MSSGTPTTDKPRMPLAPSLAVLAALRTDWIVVTTMGSAREWPKLSSSPLDFHYLPSSMGQAPALGLGLALARPNRHVLILNGDGCMLMNLGSLVTIASSGATSLTLVVLDNGIYEVTGGQPTAAAKETRFAELARAAGWPSTAEFDELTHWQTGAVGALALPGPRCISLAVAPVGSDFELPKPEPMQQRIARFREALDS